MPGYSFQPRFVEAIRAGTKGGTIRAPRATRSVKPGGHASVGETLFLWCRMRTPDRFKIGERVCAGIEPVHLYLGPGTPAVSLPDRFMRITTTPMLDVFAVFDGFECWGEMAKFWRSTHGADVGSFNGWHIRWLPLPEALDKQYGAERIERARAADWDENQGADRA